MAACSKLKELSDTDLTESANTTLAMQPFPTDYDLGEVNATRLNNMMMAAAQAIDADRAIQVIDDKPKKNNKQMINAMYSAFPILSQKDLIEFIKMTEQYSTQNLDVKITKQLNAVDFSKNIIVVVATPDMDSMSMMPLPFGNTDDSTVPQVLRIYSNVKRIGDIGKDLHIDITFSYMGNEQILANMQFHNPKWNTKFYIVPKDDKEKLFITFAEKNLSDEYIL